MSMTKGPVSRKAPNLVHGKKFEGFISDIFKPLELKFRCSWDRIIDSAAAGNFISSVEGDFRLCVKSELQGRPFAYVVECKASTEHRSLRTCLRSIVKVEQVANMRLKIRGGMYGVFLFHSVENDEIEVWSAAPVIEAHPLKRQPFHCQPCYVITKDNFHVIAKQWVTEPQQFLDRLIRSETVPVGVQHE